MDLEFPLDGNGDIDEVQLPLKTKGRFKDDTMKTDWIGELLRRNVHRVLVAYLAGSWLLAQVVEFLADTFAWPAWTLRTLVIVLLLGLPAVAAAAWFFELTPGGLVREAPRPQGAALRLRPHRRFDLAVLALAVLALGYFVATYDWRGRGDARPADEPAATLAVLPFKPIVAANRDEALEFGMADTLIMRLSGIADVAVRPLSSVRRYSTLDTDALAAGRELGVRSVLDGSVQRSGARLRVTARLLSVTDGRQLWSGQFDEQYTDIFTVQDSIADRVTAALALKLSAAEQRRLQRRPTGDTVAYDLFLNGRYHWNRRWSSGSLQKAIEYYEQAIARDPEFALAYSGLADAQALQGVFGLRTPREIYPVALENAARALQLDPDLAEAHATRGHIRINFAHDWKGALEDYDEAIRHDPRYAMARVWRGLWLMTVGRSEEGLAEFANGVELEPDTTPPVVMFARGLYWARRYGEAATELERVLEVEPENALARALLSAVYTQLGRNDEALVMAAGAAAQTPGGHSLMGVALARAGRAAEARAEAERLAELAKHRYVPAYDVASIHAALGDVDSAFLWLEKALLEPSALLPTIRVDPVMDGLRSDPRYRDIENRLHMPPG